MIASLLIWSYIIIFSFIYGATILETLQHLFNPGQELQDTPKALIALLGLGCITILACLLSLFIKMGWLAQSIFFIGGILLGVRILRTNRQLFQGKRVSIPWLLILLAIIVLLTTLENGSHGTSNPDTGIYHAQAIKWIETYPAVPGLGNLHSRFAYDSSWLVANAFFSFSFLGLRSFHVLPGAFLVMVLIYLLGGTYRLLKGHITITDVLKTLLIPLIFYTLRIQISSPGTDFPVQVWMWVVISLWLESIEIKPNEAGRSIQVEEILIFIFSIFLVTVKLSSAPVLLLPLLIFIRQIRRKAVNAFKLVLVALIILAPWFARNLILSGYWIYPAPFLVNLSPNWDWKIPLNNVIGEVRSIQAWARIPGVDTNKVLAMPLRSWLKEWFENLTKYQKAVVLGAVFSPILFAVSALTWLRRKIFTGSYIYMYVVGYIGLIFWFYEAPDIRFGYGVLASTVLLAGTPLLAWILQKVPMQKYVIFGLIALITLYQAAVFFNSIEVKTLESRIVLPTDYAGLPTVPCSIHGMKLMCAEYYNECDYGPFPCIPPGSASKNVEMRGASLRDGFRYLNNP
jgi:hypothetical protein